jgi:hypothetical protein
MHDEDVRSDRRRPQAVLYVRQRDQELVERQRRYAEAEAERRLIAQAIGMDDHEVVLDLQLADYRANTIVLLELAPSVQVAWADGSVSKGERELLFEIAAREHVAQDSPAHNQLDIWLDRPPSAHLFDTSLRAIGRILASLQPEVRASLRRKVIQDCTTIAAVSRGFLDWGRLASSQEQRVLERVVAALS